MCVHIWAFHVYRLPALQLRLFRHPSWQRFDRSTRLYSSDFSADIIRISPGWTELLMTFCCLAPQAFHVCTGLSCLCCWSSILGGFQNHPPVLGGLGGVTEFRGCKTALLQYDPPEHSTAEGKTHSFRFFKSVPSYRKICARLWDSRCRFAFPWHHWLHLQWVVSYGLASILCSKTPVLESPCLNGLGRKWTCQLLSS